MPTPLRVLILEDRPTDAELMVRELRRAMFDPNWQRVEAESDYVAHLDPALDVILADYKLPQFDAVRALQLLQERGLDIPFIVVSGAISEEVAVECMKQGAADYLLKDRLARLGQAVAQALEQRRLRRERRRAEEARQALYKASLEVQELLGLQERLDRLFQTAQTVLELDRVAVLLADPEGRWLQVLASRGVEEPLEAIRFPIGPEGGGLAQAYLTQQRVVWDGEAPLPEWLLLQPPYDRIVPFRSQAFAIVPLVVQGRAIGVLLGADWKHSRQPLEPAMLELLQLFASQAALSIEHARLYEMQRRAAIRLEATVEARTRELQTANVQLQEAMRLVEEASRHKSEFLANMSHELRTPLNSVIGFSDLLIERTVGSLNENQARFLTNIRNSGQHLLQLIRDILDLSKVEAGKVVLQPEPLPVAGTLEDIVVLARGLAHKKAQTVEAQIDPELPPLQADPVRFKQILFNLLSNAVKFTPDGGRVTVTARRVRGAESGVRSGVDSTSHVARRTSDPGEFVEIAVADTGIGIKADDLPRLFQEFVQLEAAATKRYEGTGLGLALTRRLVELHGGRIWAESAGQGRGSTFTFVLPFGGPGEVPES